MTIAEINPTFYPSTLDRMVILASGHPAHEMRLDAVPLPKRPPASAMRIESGSEYNGMELCPPRHCPTFPTAPLSLFPNAPRSPTAPLSQEHETLQVQHRKHMEKLCSATSRYKYCNIVKICSGTSKTHILQHQKICAATSKIMYCNIKNYIMQHLKK
jgi:hypothetical protein